MVRLLSFFLFFILYSESYMSPYGRQDETDQYSKSDDVQMSRDDCKSPTNTPSNSPFFKNDSVTPEDISKSYIEQIKNPHLR